MRRLVPARLAAARLGPLRRARRRRHRAHHVRHRLRRHAGRRLRHHSSRLARRAVAVGGCEAVADVERAAGALASPDDAGSLQWRSRASRSVCPALLGDAGLSEAEFALYDERPGARLEFERAGGPPDASRAVEAQALEQRRSHATRRSGGATCSPACIDAAKLGMTVVHAPVELPGGAHGVLDVTYVPTAKSASSTPSGCRWRSSLSRRCSSWSC